MDDVVEQGQRERRGWPPWSRAVAMAVVVVFGVLIVTRSHLLSAGPEPQRPTAAPTSPLQVPGENTSEGISIVVRQGDHLERYEAGSGRRPLATLPRGLPDPTPFLHATGSDGTGPLVGVDQRVLLLFRASPVRGRSVSPIGRADQVLGLSPEPGRLIVLLPVEDAVNGARVVEVDAHSGDITDKSPFPGYDDKGPWRPAAVVSSPGGGSALLMTQRAGGRLALALAWDGASIHTDGAPRLVRIGTAGRLLGVAQTRILTVAQPGICPGGACPITVLSVTRDRVLTREVQPPAGWSFGTTVAGGEGGGDPLAVVSRIGEPTRLALARLVVGGRLGLLVGGSDGLVGSVTPAGGPEGSVVFAVPRPEGLRLSVWLPGSPSAALLLDLPALVAGAELVCACR